jgi:hypothetical protein
MRSVETDVENLLRPDSRARLPFGRQLLIYLDPFALFKDASIGTAMVRERALAYNRAMRWMLVAYMQRWLLIAAGSFVGMAPTEAAAAQGSILIVPAAALGVSACVAFTVTFITLVVYVLLGAPDRG